MRLSSSARAFFSSLASIPHAILSNGAWVKKGHRLLSAAIETSFEKNRAYGNIRQPLPAFVGRHSGRHGHASPFTCAMSDGTLTERERLVYSAKLAEQAERYDGASGPGRCFILRDWLPRAAHDRGWVPAGRESAPRTAPTARRPRDRVPRYPRDVA
jgi:hypothetical protein